MHDAHAHERLHTLLTATHRYIHQRTVTTPPPQPAACMYKRQSAMKERGMKATNRRLAIPSAGPTNSILHVQRNILHFVPYRRKLMCAALAVCCPPAAGARDAVPNTQLVKVPNCPQINCSSLIRSLAKTFAFRNYDRNATISFLLQKRLTNERCWWEGIERRVPSDSLVCVMRVRVLVLHTVCSIHTRMCTQTTKVI